MVLLALDGALSIGTVAVIDGARVLAESTVAMKGAHEERLLPAVHDTLARAGIAPGAIGAVVCGAGPGSFTSLRIAASIAKGYAMGAGAPLHAVSSLLLVVAGAVEWPAAGRYLVLTDAMRGESFAALVVVDGGHSMAIEGAVRRIVSSDAEVEAARCGATAVGPGRGLDLAPHARGVARLGNVPGAIVPVDLDTWEPDYGRLAEAQVKWEAAHGRPLPAA